VLIGWLPLLLFGGLLYAGIRKVPLSSGGGLGGWRPGQGEGAVIDAERVTRFTDVAGYTTVKDRDQRGRRLSARPRPLSPGRGPRPRGVLMAGHLARQDPARPRVAGGPRPLLVGIGLGFRGDVRRLGAARVRDLFEQARTRAPAIVFSSMRSDALGAAATRRHSRPATSGSRP